MFLAASESLAPAPPQRFICFFPDCSPNYNKAWKLDAHLCKHTGERLFVTMKGVPRPSSVTTTSATTPCSHQRKALCTASGCDQKFNIKSNLKKHFESKHENQQKQYSHILSFHEEERPFVCEHAGCGKTSAMKQSLSRQAVVHDPDKKKMKLKRCQKQSSPTIPEMVECCSLPFKMHQKIETVFYCENMLETHKDDLRIYFVRGKGFGWMQIFELLVESPELLGFKGCIIATTVNIYWHRVKLWTAIQDKLQLYTVLIYSNKHTTA
eukprot:bmy_16462T0